MLFIELQNKAGIVQPEFTTAVDVVAQLQFAHAQRLSDREFTPGRPNRVSSFSHAGETNYLTPGNSAFGKWEENLPSNARQLQLTARVRSIVVAPRASDQTRARQRGNARSLHASAQKR